MIRLIEDHKQDIAGLCRHYEVRRMDLFGSAVGIRISELWSKRPAKSSMANQARKRLKDISDACAAISRFASGQDFSTCQNDEMARSAVERKLEDAEPAVADNFPDLRKIAGLRNRIIRGYDAVDDDLVWDVMQNKRPALRNQVESLLNQ